MGNILEGPRLDAASGQASNLIVFCHGYGADGRDLIGLAPYWQNFLPDTAFAAPNAPHPCDAGGMGYQWFAVARDDPASMQKGVEAAALFLEEFLAAELKRLSLDDSKLALVGFSQGTMMALHVGLRRKTAPAALIGYSGALIGGDALKDIVLRPPVLLIHGDADPMIPAAASLSAAQELTQAGFSCQHHISRGGGHSIMPDGLELGGKFLHQHLKS